MQYSLRTQSIFRSSQNEINYYYATIIGIILFNFIFFVQTRPIIDPDIYWHIRIGEEIINTHQFPLQDHHSHTFFDKPWIAKEWLSQVILAAAYSWAGWFGVVLLMAISLSLGFGILAYELMRKLSMTWVLPVLAVAFLCLAPTIVPRPHLFALPVMMAWFALLFRSAETGRPPSLMVVPLMTLWANLHGSYLFGLAFGGLLVVESLWHAMPSQRRPVFLSWMMFGLLSAVASMIHPYGFEVFRAAMRVLDLGEARLYITEWNPSDFSSFSTMEGLIMLGLASSLTTGFRLPLFRLLPLLLLLHMSLAHSRHLALLGMLAPLLLAPSLAILDRRSLAFDTQALNLKKPLLACLCLTAVTMTWFTLRPPEPIRIYAPEAALAAARKAGLRGNVLNDYDFGGYLISRDIQTFIDGRAELFGGAFLKLTLDSLNLNNLDTLDALIKDHQVSWTLLKPQTPAVHYLNRSPEWRMIYQDEMAVVHARQ